MGWSEKWYIPATDWRTARRLGDRLALIRSCMHARGVKMVWAHVGFTDRPALRWNIPSWQISTPLWGGRYSDETHSPFNCLQIRFETAEGEWANRYFCGLPDAFLHNMQLTSPANLWPPSRPAPTIGDAAVGFLNHFRYGLQWLTTNTLKVDDLGEDESPRFRLKPWSNHVVREVRNRNRGRDFLHVSFEAGIPLRDSLPGANLAFAPAFTACGLIVGVTRSAYIRRVRWYPGGGLGVIRYFFVPPSFKALNRPTVFWPYLEDLDLQNSDDAGEVTTAAHKWQNGAPNNLLDRHAVGTDADFAGEGIPPFDVTLPTPPQFIAYCGVQFIASGGVEAGGLAIFRRFVSQSGGAEAGGDGSLWRQSIRGNGGVEVGATSTFRRFIAVAGGVEAGGGGVFFAPAWRAEGGVEVGGAGEFS